MTSKGPGLYEFLTESELQQYFNAFKRDLKVHNVGQLKFVTEEDLTSLGMSRPEMRRLKKYFQKYCPQTYLSKFRKKLLPKKDGPENVGVIVADESGDRHTVRVPSKHIIPADAIVINKELGVGEFGVVQQGVWTNEEGERIQVAIKCLSKERMHTQPMEFLKEAAIMHTIDSEHIVRLYGVVLDTNALMLVTELAPLRSLLECLKEPSLRVSFPVTSLCHFCVQICDGMCYLESKRLIHRDLAARNILVFSKNKIKISDFGLSRALGVGKDYYQTNFNVNLKLPIAWCAPECINYLRFTSASDVWAFGVTLWEMFSYGFQPWAALTGHQILEAIDEPNFQRLEQPEGSPKEYYTIMLKCWQHDPAKRPKFADLINILPDLKPEQVQAVKEPEDTTNTTPSKRERLQYAVGDIITVLDKRPVSDNPCVWKGVLNNGKTGMFNPAHTVAYLGTYVPSNKSTFQRGDGKNAYSSRRRLRPDMISGPQGDLKHTGHVGLDGAYFGDVSFLGDKVQAKLLPKGTEKYHQLPKQIVTPYKPSEDHDQSNTLTRASSDVSDRAPLLKKVGEKGKFGPASEQNWSDTASEEQPDSPAWSAVQSDTSGWLSLKSDSPIHSEKQNDHEYHEISDEEEDSQEGKKEKSETCVFRSNSFDLGPSLMDEVFRALGGSTSSGPSSPTLDPPGSLPPVLPAQNSPPPVDDEANNVRNELKEIASKLSGKDSTKRKQALVKPISATDERTLDSAIAMANELASKSMLKLDGSLEGVNGDHDYHSGPPDSPATPTSPSKNSRFSFKFSSRGSPRNERRHFSEEAASIADIQSSITEEAKEVYDSIVGRPSLQCGALALESQRSECSSSSIDQCETPTHHNPLRMLRQGVTVRPKVRGNKHNLGNAFSTLDRNNGGRSSSRGSVSSLQNNFDLSTHQTLPRGFKHSKVPPPVKPKPPPLTLPQVDDFYSPEGSFSVSDSTSIDSEGSANNPLPLPPRDRTKAPVTPHKPRHQRKYPLIIPGGVANSLLRGSHLQSNGNSEKNESTSRLLIQHTHNPQLEVQGTVSTSPSTNSDRSSKRDSSNSPTPKVPPAKPPRLFSPSSLDDSFESQLACEMDALDEMQGDPEGLSPLGIAPPPFPSVENFIVDDKFTSDLEESIGRGSLYQSSDHVSCEDLLDFALDKPNSRRTQGPAHGTQSDEVHLLMKVLKQEVTAEECVETLNECDWDVHRALKLLRLRLLLPGYDYSISTSKTTLEAFSWDVAKASSYLAATSLDEDTAQV